MKKLLLYSPFTGFTGSIWTTTTCRHCEGEPQTNELQIHRLFEEIPENIVPVRIDQQCEQQEHSGDLRIFEELVARLAACNHFVEQEHHVSAVQSRNGQNIHKGKDDGEESRLHPERLPIPFSREEAADRSEAAQTGSTLFCKDIFHVADIAFQCIHTQHDTGRERLEETIFTSHRLVHIKRGNRIDPHFPGRIRMQRQRLRDTGTIEADCDILILILCKHLSHFIERRGYDAVDRDDTVFRL